MPERFLPRYVNRLAPCSQACPAGTDLPRALFAIENQNREQAWRIFRKSNPFSGACGRVCYHPCESACNRAKYDEPLAIQQLERFASDFGLTQGILPDRPAVRRDEQVAIIGSGPSGLTAAYFLAQDGFQVKVFEEHALPGGMLREGIPAYRLPSDVVDYEVACVQSAGAHIECDAPVDAAALAELLRDFHAVLLAVGSHRTRPLGIPGDDLPGVAAGLDWLRSASLGGAPAVSGECVVVGGGNTAVDVARTALRLGGKPTLLYRRSRQEMPAHPDEVEEAVREGVSLEFLTAPVKIEASDGRLRLTCQRMRLGDPDSDGRPRPIPIASALFQREAELVLTAIREEPQPDLAAALAEGARLPLPVDELGSTAYQKVFACGDAAAGPYAPGMVVHAIASGRRAAEGIRAFLTGALPRPHLHPLATYETLKHFDWRPASRALVSRLPPEARRSSFAEVVFPFSPEVSAMEAARCFNCGICVQCDWCFNYCNRRHAIVKLEQPWSANPDARFFRVLAEQCDGCGDCAAHCPRGALVMAGKGEVAGVLSHQPAPEETRW